MSQIMRCLCETFTLDQSRMLCAYFDERGIGKISVAELSKALSDILDK